MRFLVSAAAIASICFFGASAFADERTVTVPADIRSEINYHATWNKDCSQGAIPQVTFTKKPTNGKEGFDIVERLIVTNRFGSQACVGHTVKGISLYYKPNKSFRGTDTVEYNLNYSGQRRFEQTITINVR